MMLGLMSSGVVIDSGETTHTSAEAWWMDKGGSMFDGLGVL